MTSRMVVWIMLAIYPAACLALGEAVNAALMILLVALAALTDVKLGKRSLR